MVVFYFIFIVNGDIVFLVSNSIAKNSFEIGLSSVAISKNSKQKIVIFIQM